MSERAKGLAERLKAFNNEVIEFVKGCSDAGWRKVCASEDWSVGVVARHIGAGHYQAMGLVKMMIQGEKLPQMSMDDIIKRGNDHAREHADCTREEVIDILKKQGEAAVDFMAGLSDSELDRKAYLPLVGQEWSAQQFVENVIIRSGSDHLSSMRAAAGA